MGYPGGFGKKKGQNLYVCVDVLPRRVIGVERYGLVRFRVFMRIFASIRYDQECTLAENHHDDFD